MQQQNFTLPIPPLQVRAGVLVVDGFGMRCASDRGKLRVEDGIGGQRRSIALDRAGCGLERLVLLGKAGYTTLEASRGCVRSVRRSCRSAATARCSRTPFRSATTVPDPPSAGARGHERLGRGVARDLIARKLDGQRRILARLRAPICASSMPCEPHSVRPIRSSACASSKRMPQRCTSRRGSRDGFASANATSHESRRAGFAANREPRCSPAHLARQPIADQCHLETIFTRCWNRNRASRCSHRVRSHAGRPPCESAQPRLVCARCDGAGTTGRGCLSARPLGGSRVFTARDFGSCRTVFAGSLRR